MKVTGPMFSLTASGSIGGVITAATWKGRPYFRQLVKPSNPKSAGQTATRAMFKWLTQSWAGLSTNAKATWDALAAATNVTSFNAYCQYNQREWTQNLAPSQEYPAARTIPGDDVQLTSATAGVKQITIVGTPDNVNQANQGAIIHRSETNNFTPSHTTVIGVINSESNVTFSYVDSGLISGTTYYYKAFGFTTDGTLSAVSPQVTATAN